MKRYRLSLAARAELRRLQAIELFDTVTLCEMLAETEAGDPEERLVLVLGGEVSEDTALGVLCAGPLSFLVDPAAPLFEAAR